MHHDPRLDGLGIGLPLGQRQPEVDKFIVASCDRHAVDLQQDEQGQYPDALVAIDEGWFVTSPKARRAALAATWLELLTCHAGVGRVELRLQEVFVPHSVRPAGLGQQLGVQSQDVPLGEPLHLASSSKAALCLAISRLSLPATPGSRQHRRDDPADHRDDPQ